MSIVAGVFALFFSLFPFAAGHPRAFEAHGGIIDGARVSEAHGGIIDRPKTAEAHGGIIDGPKP